jgi:hypothetical protein
LFGQWIGRAAGIPAFLDCPSHKCVTRRLRFDVPECAIFTLLGGVIAEPLRLQLRNGESAPPSGRQFTYRPLHICQSSSL